jgi:hypothetical protein
MKAFKVLWIPLLLSACSFFERTEIQPKSLLTPYVTRTALAEVAETATVIEPTATLEPTMTPTPFVHVLASGETISSLSFNYGIEDDEILAINPEVTPKALSIGMEIMIPYIGPADEEETEKMSVISEPLALDVSSPRCAMTAEDGLWCVANVKNALDQNANAVTVTFTLKNSSGETVGEQTVPTVMNLLEIGDEIPAAAYFSPHIPAGYSVSASLTTALPLEESSAVIQPLDIKVNSIDMDGRAAHISAVIPQVDEASGISSVWVALIAYDENSNVVGVRRFEYAPTTDREEGQPIKVSVYSNNEDIKQVVVLGEALTPEQ